MRKVSLDLSDKDKAELQEIVAKGVDWRARDRARTLLYFGEGWSAKSIGEQQNLNLDRLFC